MPSSPTHSQSDGHKLREACKTNDIASVKALIEAGADPHLVATNGRTAEHMMDMKKLHHKHLHKHVLKHVEKTRRNDEEL